MHLCHRSHSQSGMSFCLTKDIKIIYTSFKSLITKLQSKHWKIVQLSYADMHPMFSKKNFPNLYRIVPSENEFNEPRIELLRKFNWTKVGTLYQNKPRYSLGKFITFIKFLFLFINLFANRSGFL